MGRVLAFHQPEGSPDDIARERRIADIAARLKHAIKAGPWGVVKAGELQAQLKAECAARSPAQVERMERARGLR